MLDLTKPEARERAKEAVTLPEKGADDGPPDHA